MVLQIHIWIFLQQTPLTLARRANWSQDYDGVKQRCALTYLASEEANAIWDAGKFSRTQMSTLGGQNAKAIDQNFLQKEREENLNLKTVNKNNNLE